MPPALVGDCGSSPARTELLDKEPCLLVGGGRRTPIPVRPSEPGLLPKSEDELSSLPRPAMYPAPAPAAAARPAWRPPLGDESGVPSRADMRAMRPPGRTSNPGAAAGAPVFSAKGPCLEGEGWLKTLPLWLSFLLRRLRRQTMQRKMRPAMRMRPTIEPITIPAMAPPERPPALPLSLPSSDGAEVLLVLDVGEEVGGVNVMEGTKEGRTTSAHLLSTSEL